ncbi:MAG TPA: DUF6448 family protein [Kofleriaceae bacterium]|nr:DUF6448 family protein [Kofleriaceae bacterium]
MDGPVVKAGQKALETNDLDAALIWIKPEAEAELRAVFKQAVSVRKLGSDARALADRMFLETLVRLHRAGEGEPYTGLKPAGTDLGAAIPAADRAIQSGSPREVSQLLVATVQRGVDQKFRRVMATRKFKPHDVAAGREYVESYVTFLHFVERVFDDATATAHGHEAEAAREAH